METMVRSNKWKMVYFLKETTGQLFDLENDPEERNNLWESMEHVGVSSMGLGYLLQRKGGVVKQISSSLGLRKSGWWNVNIGRGMLKCVVQMSFNIEEMKMEN